jgi:hypothetical protein
MKRYAAKRIAKFPLAASEISTACLSCLRAIGQQSIEHRREPPGERFSIELAQHAHVGAGRRKRAGLSPAVGGNDGSIKGVLTVFG